jgi:nitrogen fixation/metabolism regulation signal transduction histidine kinase
MEAWQKLIRVLTHEIMNSITPIISLSETLSERGIPSQLGEKEYSVMLQAMQTSDANKIAKLCGESGLY